jgi:perosamine synthetase
MAVARGSVQHSLSDDFRSALKVLIKPKRYCGAADKPEKEALAAELREYFDTDFATLFPYARTGFYATLKALNLPAGSEILLTPVTIGPMYEVCRNLNLQPVFVDIELQTFGPDLALLESKLEKKPAAFLLTYLFGMVPDLRRITELCAKHGVPLIEDFSHNIGARFEGRLLGPCGVAGIYSASLLKYVDSYNGSFVITPSKKMHEAMSHLSQGFSATDVKRVRKIIFRSVLWNVALSRWTFTFFTLPSVRLLNSTWRMTPSLLIISRTLPASNAKQCRATSRRLTFCCDCVGDVRNKR